MNTKRPRFTRAKASWRPPLALQERDIELLKSAEQYRLLTTPQYALLFGDESERGVYRRLAALFHHGYLDRLKGDPSAPIVYALAPRGAEALVERGLLKEIPDFTTKNAELQHRYIGHLGMIADFRITLSLATRDSRPDARLAFFQPEGAPLHDRVSAGRRTIPIYPDGFFSLHFLDRPEGKNRAYFFLEADRSTMRLERVRAKLAGYALWYHQGRHTEKYGIRTFRVLTITPSEERAQHLLGLTRKAPELADTRAIFWFAPKTRYTPERPPSILEPIWQTAAREERLSILPAS